jgi:hypothetical protein
MPVVYSLRHVSMRSVFFFICLLVSLATTAQGKNIFLAFGIDYRDYPIDIEDAPRGAYTSNGRFYDNTFWQTASIHGRAGIAFNSRWKSSIAFYTRYNHFHWQDIVGQNPKNCFKYDVFADVERLFAISKNKKNWLSVLAGLGVTNLNTGYDIFLREILPSGDTTAGRRYSGTFTHFTPRFSVGYQLGKIKMSLDTYFVEGADRTNLLALWIGGTISYEFVLKKKKQRSH